MGPTVRDLFKFTELYSITVFITKQINLFSDAHINCIFFTALVDDNSWLHISCVSVPTRRTAEAHTREHTGQTARRITDVSGLSIHWSFDRKILLDDEAKAVKLISNTRISLAQLLISTQIC